LVPIAIGMGQRPIIWTSKRTYESHNAWERVSMTPVAALRNPKFKYLNFTSLLKIIPKFD